MSQLKDALKSDLSLYVFPVKLLGTGETVHIKPLSTKDMKKLLFYENAEDLQSIENMLDDIVRASMVEDYDLDELYLNDRFYLLFEIRKSSKGTTYELPVFTCPKCKGQSLQKVDLNEVKVIPLNVNMDRMVKITESISVEMDLTKRKHQKNAFEYLKGRSFTNKDEQSFDVAMATFANTIAKVFVNGAEVEAAFEDKMYLIDNMPKQSLEVIKDWYNTNKFGLDEFVIERKCPHCGHSEKVEIELTSMF